MFYHSNHSAKALYSGKNAQESVSFFKMLKKKQPAVANECTGFKYHFQGQIRRSSQHYTRNRQVQLLVCKTRVVRRVNRRPCSRQAKE